MRNTVLSHIWIYCQIQFCSSIKILAKTEALAEIKYPKLRKNRIQPKDVFYRQPYEYLQSDSNDTDCPLFTYWPHCKCCSIPKLESLQVHPPSAQSICDVAYFLFCHIKQSGPYGWKVFDMWRTVLGWCEHYRAWCFMDQMWWLLHRLRLPNHT